MSNPLDDALKAGQAIAQQVAHADFTFGGRHANRIVSHTNHHAVPGILESGLSMAPTVGKALAIFGGLAATGQGLLGSLGAMSVVVHDVMGGGRPNRGK